MNMDEGLDAPGNDFDSNRARADKLDQIERKINSSSTDIDDLPSKNDQSFDAFNVYQSHLNNNTADGAPVDYERSPRRGQPQSILK